MLEGLQSYGFNTSISSFKLVYWADIFHDKPLDESESDTESPYFLDERYTLASPQFETEDHNTRKKIVEFISRQLNRIFLNDDLTLNYKYITDIIVSKYFKELELYYSGGSAGVGDQPAIARDLIRERLISVLHEHRGDDIMLISHSMGSIVAFDVLTLIAPQICINTFITMGSPLGLPVVISKIAAEQSQITHVSNIVATPPGVIGKWYNFSDIMDKVALNYKLSDNFSENGYRVKPEDILVINTYEINGERNPHKSFGYLRTPEFANILNDFIISESLSMKEKAIRRIVLIYTEISRQILTFFKKG